MGDYCDLHAVRLPTGDDLNVVRVDGDSEEDVRRAARALAEMCGVDPAG